MVNRYLQVEKMPSAYTDESFPDTSLADLAHVLDLNLDLTEDKSKIYTKPSSRRLHRRSVKSQKTLSGSIDTPIFTKEVPSLLYYLLGAVTTVVGTPQLGSNTHTITKADSVPAFWLAVGRDVKEHQYTGGLMNSGTIDLVPDDTVNASFDTIVRKELATAAINTPTIPDFDVGERAFGGAELSASIGAAESAVTLSNIFESVSLSLENNIQGDARALGNQHLPRNYAAELAITGNFDLAFDDASNYDDFIADNQKRIQFNAVHDAGVAAHRSIDIDLPRIEYDTNSLPTEDVQRYVEALEFTVNEDALGEPIIIKIVNEETNATISA